MTGKVVGFTARSNWKMPFEPNVLVGSHSREGSRGSLYLIIQTQKLYFLTVTTANLDLS